jgi:hypothetical protein
MLLATGMSIMATIWLSHEVERTALQRGYLHDKHLDELDNVHGRMLVGVHQLIQIFNVAVPDAHWAVL